MGMKIFSLGGVQGAQHPLVKIWDIVYISETMKGTQHPILYIWYSRVLHP